jgi:hypothetical protein
VTGFEVWEKQGLTKQRNGGETEKYLRRINEREEVLSFCSSHSCIRMNTFHFIFARSLVRIPSKDRLLMYF